jgi:RND family efflux transporter MFP subunit
MKMNNRYIIPAAILIILAYSCVSSPEARLEKLKKQQASIDEKIKSIESGKTQGNESPDPEKFPLVGIAVVTPGVFDHYIKVQGMLDGDQNAAVYADVPGTVTNVYADVGQKVTKGQVLARIDDAQYVKQLENLKTQYNFAADMYEKQKRLWDQKIGSEVQYLQSKTQKESLEQQISSMKDQLDKFRIKSPINGTIEANNIKPGSVVSPDPRSVAFRVVGFRELKAVAEVSEAYAAKIKKGDRVMVQFPDLNQQIETAVDFVSSYIDPVNRTFMIESRIDKNLPGMKANMVAIVSINDYHSDSSIRVPMNIIQKDLNGSYVYVVRNKDNFYGAFRQPVVIGSTYNGIAEITEGLETSDKVVTTGFQELIDGEYVRFENPSEAYVGN